MKKRNARIYSNHVLEQKIDYIITRGDKISLEKFHQMGHRGTCNAIALAIGWNTMDCFLYLLDQGYPVNEDACVEALVNKDIKFLHILQERKLFQHTPTVVEIIYQFQR